MIKSKYLFGILIILLFISLLPNNNQQFTRGLIIIVCLIIAYHIYYNPPTSKKYKIPVKMKEAKPYFHDNIYRQNPKILEQLTVLINKFNYWYQKSIKPGKISEPDKYLEYVQNSKLYQQTICDCLASLDLSIPHDNNKEMEIYQQFRDNLDMLITNKIDRLQRLIINNNISPTYNNNALNGMSQPNDINGFLYHSYQQL